MNAIIVTILIQAACYGASMMIPLFLVAFLMRGFFIKYLRAKASLGRLVMVKIRTSLRDYFSLGELKEGQLYFKSHKDGKITNIPPGNNCFYRCLGVYWIDIDEGTNATSTTDYKAIEGFDAQKFSGLYERALMKPAITPTQEKIILLCVIVAIAAAAAAAVMSYMSLKEVHTIAAALPALRESMIELARQSTQTIVGSAGAA